MKDLFVPYELAVKLKEKGFKKSCIAGYYEDTYNKFPVEFNYSEYLNTEAPEYITNNYKGEVAAPLWQQVVDWLREEKGIGMNPVQCWEKDYIWEVFQNRSHYNSVRGTYYSALQNAIEHALTLITTNP